MWVTLVLDVAGNEHANADSLSRLPLGGPLKDPPPPAELVFLMETRQASPVTPQSTHSLHTL